MDMESIMNMAKEFQQQIPERLAKMAVTGTAGGGAIKVVVNGKKEVTNIEISPDAPKDPEILADLILAALNGAYLSAEREISQLMPGMANMGGLEGVDLSSIMDMFRK